MQATQIVCICLTVASVASCGSSTENGAPAPCCDPPPPPPPPETKDITLTIPDYVASSSYTFDNWLYSTQGVEVFDYSAGIKGEKLGQFAVVSGEFIAAFEVPETTSAFLLEASAPCNWEKAYHLNPTLFNRYEAYTDYTDGGHVCQSAIDKILAVVSAENQTVSFTPYTHVAAGLAAYRVSQGDSALQAVNTANNTISNLVGVNILTTDTTDKLSDMVFSDTPEAFYTAILSGLPTLITHEMFLESAVLMLGDAGYGVFDFADLMKRDITGDGMLDGIETTNGSGNPVMLGGIKALNADLYRHDIAAYASINTRTAFSGGGSVQPILTRLLNFNDQLSIVYSDATLIELDEPGPVLGMSVYDWNFFAQNPNVNGSDGFNIFFGDVVGMLNYEYRDVYVDNVFFANTCDGTGGSDYNCWVNTTLYPNGWHTVKMVFTNIMGNSVSLSINVNFQN